MPTAIWLICLEIFFGRIADVTLGTVRVVLTVKEKTFAAALIGIIEMMLWFFIVRNAMSAEGNVIVLGLSYAGGFAVGTLVGGFISRKFIKGNVVLQIVVDKNDELVQLIRESGFGVSVVDVKGSEYGDEKYMLFCDIDKFRLDELKELVHKHESNAFIMVSETKHVFNGFIK